MEKTVDKRDFKSKLLTAGVIAILCLVFVVGFIWGLNSVLAMEGSFPPETDTHGVLTEPKTNEDVVALLNNAVQGAVAGKPKAVTSDEFSTDIDEAETDSNEQFNATLKYAADGFEDGLNENFEGTETNFGEDLSIRIPNITSGDIESFECKYFERNYIYQCDICNAESDELLNGCPECGSGNLYVQKDRGEYVVDVVLKQNDAVLKDNFAPRSADEILKLFGDKFDKTLDIKNIDVSYNKLTVSFRINRETGELTYLEYNKEMTADTSLAFKNNFSVLGNVNVKFNLSEKVKNEIIWPSLELSEKEMVIEPKKSDNLTATLTCEDPTKPVVKWVSSDENVVEIDDEGYMKAGGEAGSVTITASFEYQGKTYTDTCVVNVAVPVESMSISKRKVKLSVGETKQLDAKVSPSNSTVTTKKWYTDDSSVATVDENGIVTAISSGTVTVYALSDDGYFKSSCEVTVK